MSDKKQEIIPINMVYQSNNRLQNCKVLINRSDSSLVPTFDLGTSSNVMQTSKNTPRPQSVVKVPNSANNQTIVRTIGGTKIATIGRVVAGGQQPALIMQSTKSLINQQPLQQLPQQSLQHKLQQQKIFQTNSQPQTILIPQSIKSPSNFIYQALPISTTQRINKSFIKRSTSNTAIDNTSLNNNNINLTKSCNNLNSNNNNISNNNNKISNNNNNISNNTKIYRVVGGQPSHIKTTSIIRPPTSSELNKSNSISIFNSVQQLNKPSQQTTTTTTMVTQRLILPATNQFQMSFASSSSSSKQSTTPLISPVVQSSITFLPSPTHTSTSLSSNHHHHNTAAAAAVMKRELVDATATAGDVVVVSDASSHFSNFSFSLIPNSVSRVSSQSDLNSTNSPNNNNNYNNNNNNNNNIRNHSNNSNNIIISDNTNEWDYVTGYKAKVSEQKSWLTTIESKLRQRKPCNCTKSQCLKLYCECFANGEFCKDCNCCNCANNIEHEDERARAVRNCIERNPHAFHPKIGKGGSNRHHNKGCNCKRSGCLKNYCECYEAKILCSHLCRCVSCRNYEDSSDRQKLMQLADVAEARVQQQTAADNKLSMHILGTSSPVKPHAQTINGQRPPYTFVTLDVIEAISACLIAEADDHQTCSEGVQERFVLEEFGRCLSQVIEMASKSKSELHAWVVVEQGEWP